MHNPIHTPCTVFVDGLLRGGSGNERNGLCVIPFSGKSRAVDRALIVRSVVSLSIRSDRKKNGPFRL